MVAQCLRPYEMNRKCVSSGDFCRKFWTEVRERHMWREKASAGL